MPISGVADQEGHLDAVVQVQPGQRPETRLLPSEIK
jgi:hypothetical protein